jgi:hypothetical protein
VNESWHDKQVGSAVNWKKAVTIAGAANDIAAGLFQPPGDTQCHILTL